MFRQIFIDAGHVSEYALSCDVRYLRNHSLNGFMCIFALSGFVLVVVFVVFNSVQE